jgi:predicted permease
VGLWDEIGRRLGYLGRRSRFERELEDEVRFHVEARADELEQEGLPRDAALLAARREFGSSLRAREETRTAWQFRWIEDLGSDLRYAARAFRRSPSFALTAICCLALGIGANTTIFSVAMEALFSRPSCRDPRSLAQISIGGTDWIPMEQYRFLRDAGIFDGVGGINIQMVTHWRDGDTSYKLAATRVTENFFEVTGVPLAMGRAIQKGDGDVTVLTDTFWRRRLGADPNILGRKLLLDSKPFTVIGVLPRGHRTLVGFGFMPDLLVPTDPGEAMVYARLPEGMSHAAAYARLESVCQQMDGVYPDPAHKWAKGIAVSGVGGLERLRHGGLMSSMMPVTAFFAMLMAVVGLVLLIACANVSSLLLARSFSRSRELAIRFSLGGGRGRIIRQLLAESLLLALGGTCGGLLINLALTRLISGIGLPVQWVQLTVEPDWRLLAYSIAIGFAVALAAGLAPAIKGARAGIEAALKGREPGMGSRRWPLRNVLVAGQLAVSIVLLSGALVFARNLSVATSLDLGFDTSHTVWATFSERPDSCTMERFESLADAALQRLRALGGVEAASLARTVPAAMPVRVAGEIRTDASPHAFRVVYNLNRVGVDYFRTMRIPILRGRPFLDTDKAGAPAVAIVNENLARLLFGSADPVGHSVRLPGDKEVRIAGVARNSKYSLLWDQNGLALYGPYAQDTIDSARFVSLVVRAKGAPEPLVRTVGTALAAADPVADIEVKTMHDAFQASLLPSRAGAVVFGAMSLLGLGLASIGLYGVLLFAVSRRRRELGIRVALGATPADVLSMVAGESARLVAVGAAIGLALAVFAVRPLSMFLAPGVRATDPANFVAVASGLSLVAALATVAPAARALRVDPAVALREE